MSRNTNQLIVTLDAEPDTDTEDLERLTRQLREELAELDVEADLMTGGPAPANAKAGDAITWGALLLTLAASGGAITTLINVLQAWLTRHDRRCVTLEFQDALKDGSQGPVMVVIPAGRFQMGSPLDEPERRDDERQHEVEVAPFSLGKYEVTFEEYDRFATATKREKPSDESWGRGRRPVINVTWVDAVAYAEWLSRQTGQTYRLPTEAEWEYAARAGTTTPFCFGVTISTEQANYFGYGLDHRSGQNPLI